MAQLAARLAEMARGAWRLLPAVQDPSTMSKAEFMAQGNDAFMNAVRDGKIPKEIADSPAAMQALQNLAGSSADEFLMQLGKLAGDYHRPVSAQNDNHVFQRFCDPVRRFIDDHSVL